MGHGEEVDAGLRRASSYPHAASGVEVLETHISRLYFAGDRVYKVKKAVELGFLDYRELEARKHFCEEEVRLNRRLAPDTYLGVAAVVREDGGVAVVGAGEKGEREVLEWAVAMRRLPAGRMLSALLERGEIDNAMLDRLARLLADFHARCPTGPGVDEHGAPEAVAHNVGENFTQLEPHVGETQAATAAAAVASPRLHAFLRRRAEAFLDSGRELLLRRVADGRIREGHGDLHAENVCYLPEGPVAYDCIEFNRRFRCGDVAADIAFLAMDLDYRGFTGFGGMLTRMYAGRAGDGELEALMPFYKAYRAVVRGKVAAMTAAGLAPELGGEKRLESMRYLQLAAGYDLPPALVLLCGLPGTGKSWLARRIAGPLHAAVLQSDVRRKHLAGLRSGGHDPKAYGEGLYSKETRERTYDSLLESEARQLLKDRSVVLDATFPRVDLRRRFVDVAARLERPFFVVHVTAPEGVVRERMERRARDPECRSDADFAVYLRAREEFEPPTEVAPERVVEVESGSQPAEIAVGRLLDAMIALS